MRRERPEWRELQSLSGAQSKKLTGCRNLSYGRPEEQTSFLGGRTRTPRGEVTCLQRHMLDGKFRLPLTWCRPAQAEIKVARRNINNLRFADGTTLMAESEEELKKLLMKVKEETEKGGSKLNIQKTKIMASSPITSWQTDGETMETVRDFILGGSKITADGEYSHETKRHLLLGRKAMTNLDSILKSRDIPLPTKVCLVKAMVFPVVMYGCESWTIKKTEHRRIDAFELWCWRKLSRVPWTARRSNQSILKKTSPEY